MAFGVSSAASSAVGGAGGFALDAQRAAIAVRRRETPETREEIPGSAGTRGEAGESAPSAQRVTEAAGSRETRQDRIRLSQVTDTPQRPAIAAYLGVERATPADPSQGELLGIDIYV